MTRPILRLVEPLSESSQLPEMMEGNKIEVLSQNAEVQSVIQLFLLWPEYSSSVIKLGSSTSDVEITYDRNLSEIDSLLLVVTKESYNTLKIEGSFEIVFEVFGLAYQFRIDSCELSEDFIEGEPSVAFSVPSGLKRLGVRNTRRITLEQPAPISLVTGGVSSDGLLLDVSSNAFKISVANDYMGPGIGNILRIAWKDSSFEVICKAIRNESIIVGPLLNSPSDLGCYFEIYTQFAYPMLRQRHSFSSDPVVTLAKRTGHYQKFCEGFEGFERFETDFEEAFKASKSAQYKWTADFIAVDNEDTPVGASALTNAFVAQEKTPVWAFHSVCVISDAAYFSQTQAIYSWRADYLLTKNEKCKVVLWYDNTGKWSDRVYAKFQRLTRNETSLEPIVLNRYLSKDINPPNYASSNYFQTRDGDFYRFKDCMGPLSVGLGVPHLNMAGGLDMVFYSEDREASPDNIKDIQAAITKVRPKKFMAVTPTKYPELEFEGYDKKVYASVTRQILTSYKTLSFYISSIEHTQAIARRKYGT